MPHKELRAKHEPAPNELAPPQEQRREEDAPERLGRDERRDHAGGLGRDVKFSVHGFDRADDGLAIAQTDVQRTGSRDGGEAVAGADHLDRAVGGQRAAYRVVITLRLQPLELGVDQVVDGLAHESGKRLPGRWFNLVGLIVPDAEWTAAWCKANGKANGHANIGTFDAGIEVVEPMGNETLVDVRVELEYIDSEEVERDGADDDRADEANPFHRAAVTG